MKMNILSFLKSLYRQYKNIAKNSFFLSVVEGIKLILPFIAMPYIIHVCGVDNYGRIIFAQAIMAYFTMMVNFGLNIVTVKDIADNLDSPQKISQIVSSFLALRLILILIGLAVLLMLILFSSILRPYRLLLLFCYIAVIAEGLLVTAFFQAVEKMYNITIVQIFSVVFYVSTLFILVRKEADFIFVPLLQSTGLLLSAVLGIVLMCKKYRVRLSMPRMITVWQLLKRSSTFAISRLSVSINANLAKIFTGLVLSMQEVALIDLAQKISDAALLPVSILDQAIYPHNAKNQNRIFVTKTFWIMFALAICCAGIMFAGTPIAVKILGNGKLDAAVPLAYCLCIKVIINVLLHYTGTPMLVAFGYPAPFNLSVIVSAIMMTLSYFVLYMLDKLSLGMFIVLLIAGDAIILSYRLFYCLKYKLLLFKLRE